MHTSVIYLIGKPGTGKYSIAKELETFGFIVCDNQLLNNPIFTLLNYDGFSKIPAIGWEAIRKIRDVVLDFIASEKNHNYVLTKCLYEDEGDCRCYSQVQAMAQKRRSLFFPIKLLISENEHLKRITEPSRRDRWKSIDPQEIYETKPLITVEHPHFMEFDVSQLTALEAALIILKHVQGSQPIE